MPDDSFRTKVIVNPAAGSGRARKQWMRLRPAIEDLLPNGADAAFTTGPGAAIRLTREALQGGYDRILAVGGDGTFNEVVNGFLDDDGQPLDDAAVLVPVTCATGGDFRRTAGTPVAPAAVAEALCGGPIRSVDVGRLTYTIAGGGRRTRYFLNVASFGMGGVVDRRIKASALPHWMGGTAKFFWAITQAMLRYRNKRVSLAVDGRSTGRYVVRNVAVANGRYFGGGLKVAPGATLDDGRLDVVVLGDFSRLDFVRHIGKLYAGTHLSLDETAHFRGATVTAESEETVLLDIDGEPLGRLPARFEVLPRALRLQGGSGSGD